MKVMEVVVEWRAGTSFGFPIQRLMAETDGECRVERAYGSVILVKGQSMYRAQTAHNASLSDHETEEEAKLAVETALGVKETHENA